MEYLVRGLQFLSDHAELIATIAGILLAFVETARATGNLRQGLLSLMLQAEKAAAKGTLGGLTGERIMDLVVQLAMTRVVPALPVYIRPFITEERVRRFANYVYVDTKLFLETGRLIEAVEVSDQEQRSA